MQLLPQGRNEKLLASHKSFYILFSMYIFPFVLCGFSKLPDSPNQHKSIFFPFSSFFSGGRLCSYFHWAPPGTDPEGRQVCLPHPYPEYQALHLTQGHLPCGATVVVPLPFSVTARKDVGKSPSWFRLSTWVMVKLGQRGL